MSALAVTGRSNSSFAPPSRLDPIVTSLGKVGGGGYGTGVLDAQRENNRLTGETNSLIRETNKRLEKLGRGKPVMAFG